MFYHHTIFLFHQSILFLSYLESNNCVNVCFQKNNDILVFWEGRENWHNYNLMAVRFYATGAKTKKMKLSKILEIPLDSDSVNVF